MKIIAEIGANHDGEMDRALQIINSVDGADIVKFQYWTPGTMAVPHVLTSGLWKGSDLVGLYEQAQTPLEWFPDLFEFVQSSGMTPACSVFDTVAVEEMEKMDCPIYKIASYEAIDIELVKCAAQTGKPLIISTGQITRPELTAVLDEARKWTRDITLLHCVSAYPSPIEEMNLAMIPWLRQTFQVNVGLSDHSASSVPSIAAAAMGATAIEKHVTLNRDSIDGGFALLPPQFNFMVRYVRAAVASVGAVNNSINDGPFDLRRSLYYERDVGEPGWPLNAGSIKTARPNRGVSPLEMGRVLGKVSARQTRTNDPVRYEDFL